jgi:(2Fe-2S) ferredoxin
MSKSFTTPFHVVGKCLGFVLKDGYKPKYLKLEVSEREYWIKIPKALRETLIDHPGFAEGTHVEVWGTQEQKGRWDKLKLEATDLQPVEHHLSVQVTADSPSRLKPVVNPSKPSKQRILICQKSNCWQHGGKRIFDAIQTTLCDRGLTETVKVQLTGCLKDCKQAPNLVILPDKTRYHNVQAKSVESILDKHFANATPSLET